MLGNFPSGNFSKVRLGGPSAAAQQTWEDVAWEITNSGSYHLEKYPWEVGSWENTFGKVPIICLTSLNYAFEYSTVVSNFINTMKTTFDLNFDLYQAFTQHKYTINENRETVN